MEQTFFNFLLWISDKWFLVLTCVPTIILFVSYVKNDKLTKEECFSIFSTFGVMLTFAGIYIGLKDFNSNNLEASIPGLLDGLKISFQSSIAGMILGISTGFFVDLLSTKDKSEKNADIIKDIAIKIKEQNSLMKDLNNNFKKSFYADKEQSSNLSQSFLEMERALINISEDIKSLREEEDKNFEDLIVCIKNVLSDLSSNSTDKLVESLNEVMISFNDKISDKLGDSICLLENSVKLIYEYQKGYCETHKNNMIELEKTSDIIGSWSKHADCVSENMSKLNSDLTNVIRSSEEMKASFEDISRFGKKAQDTGDKIDNFFRDFSELFAERVTQKTKEHTEYLSSITFTILDKISQEVSK